MSSEQLIVPFGTTVETRHSESVAFRERDRPGSGEDVNQQSEKAEEQGNISFERTPSEELKLREENKNELRDESSTPSNPIRSVN